MDGEVLSRRSTLALGFATLLLAACAGQPVVPPPTLQRLSEEEAASRGAPLPRPLTVQEVLRLTEAGEPAERILHGLRASGWDYRLSDAEASELAAAGVAPTVIEHLTAGRRAEEEAEAARRREEEAWIRWQLAYPPYYGPPYYGAPWHGWPPAGWFSFGW